MTASNRFLSRVSGFSFSLLLTVVTTGAGTEPIVPQEPIVLFGADSDLSAFYTWLPEYGYEDPNRVFTVVDRIDGESAIRISGQDWGGLVTKERYRDYRLVFEYRWGEVTWKPREDKAKDSGILLHVQGPDGGVSRKFDSPWMRSIEFQIIEGGTGDIILLPGFEKTDREILPSRAKIQVKEGNYFDPAGEWRIFDRGRVNWWGRDRAWTDTLGFRGENDLERPGEWSRLEAICRGDTFAYYVNGELVLRGKELSLTEGKILIQSEAAELYVRRFELHPLPTEE